MRCFNWSYQVAGGFSRARCLTNHVVYRCLLGHQFSLVKLECPEPRVSDSVYLGKLEHMLDSWCISTFSRLKRAVENI